MNNLICTIVGLIFVVDSADASRLEEAREELHAVLADDEMREVPVIVIANKQDLPTALSPSRVMEALCLGKMGSRKWHVQGATATNGDGIYESMEAMARLVKEAKQNRGHAW